MSWPYIKSLKLDTYKLFLSIVVIVLFCLVIWIGVLLFTQQLPPIFTALTGSILFIVVFAVFALMVSILRRNIRRSPSFKLVAFSLIGIVLVFTFAGVQPLAMYKDSIVGKVSLSLSQFKSQSQPELPPSTLNGTYVTTLQSLWGLGSKQTASFSKDTMIINNFMGQIVYKYSVPGGLNDGKVMVLINVVDGKESQVPFQYINEQDIFILEGLQYHR